MAEQAPQRHSSNSSDQRDTFNHRDSLTNLNVFSDDFALEPSPSASESSSPAGDGVSPSSTLFRIPRRPLASNQPSSPTQDRSQTRRSSLEYGRFSPSSSRDSRPLSPNFNHALGTEFASDGPKESSRPHRSISTISNFSMPRTQSPYQGATGPSHPYGMYPQDIGLARSSSSATNSTMRMPDRSFAGVSGPSQPYGMYPQNTVPEDETSPAAGAIQPTPGFPGLGQTYRRRFAPGGEEAEDLVGPDGYTEQLPPYTRYPNNVPPKNRHSGLEGPTGGTRDQSHSTESESRTQTGGSQDTLNASHSGDVMGRHLVIDDSLTQLNSPRPEGPEPPSEGGHFKERVKQKGRRRVCFGRMPLWLVMGLLFIVAVLLGAVIGGVLGRVKGQSEDNEDRQKYHSTVHASGAPADPLTKAVTATTTTTLIDAVPFTGSTSLPTLPTGSFIVNLNSPTNVSKDCLADSEQSNAWSCCGLGAPVQMEVDFYGANPTASVSYSTPTQTNYQWGAQPPSFQGSSSITLMRDKDDLSKGPAYFFQQSFDKIVVLREHEFHANVSKRSFTGAGEFNDYGELEERVDVGEYKDYSVLEERDDPERRDPSRYTNPTDKAWFCFWNGTILEAFIFVTLNTTTDIDDPSAADPGFTSTSIDTIPTPPYPSPPSIPTPNLPVTIPLESASPTTTPAVWNHQRRDILQTNYPKVVKFEERYNTQNDIKPYCQKMQIMNDGTPSPLTDTFGNLIRHDLDTTEPDDPDSHYKRRRSWFEVLSTLVKRDTSTNSGCQCQWEMA